MNTYIVKMPFAGAVTISVEANNEEEAKEKFYESVTDISFDNKTVIAANADIEWDYYEEMGRGNVRYYPCDKAEIYEAESDTDNNQ